MSSKISRITESSAPVVLLIMLAIVVAGCSSQFVAPGKETNRPPAPVAQSIAPSTSLGLTPTNGLVQSSAAGAVTIDLRWLGEKSNSLVFDVAMNTHSVDLDQYDLGKLAVLRDDAAKEYRPVSWKSAPGGHHRSGTLSFPIPDSLTNKTTRFVEIVIEDVAGIQKRVLRWEL